MNVREKLDRLYGLRLERNQLTFDLDDKIAELKRQINDIETQKDERASDIEPEIQRIEDEITKEVHDLKQTIKGSFLQAIYTKGAERIDSKKLRILYPEIAKECTKTGQPSVRLAEVKPQP